MPLGQGLFGGATPYPVSPQMQPGLMQDAWRQFGVQLLANAQNPNVGQGLAAALASGRQAYAGGAQEAYQVGRQEKQDKQYQQFRDAQIQAAEALAEQRRQDAETARRQAEEDAETRARTGEEIRQILEGMTPDERAAFQRARLLGEQGLPAALVTELSGLPEEQAPANWRAVPGVPGMVFNPADPTQTMRVATPPAKAAEPEEPGGLSETTRRQFAMAEYKAALEQHEALWEATKQSPAYRDLAGTTTMAPPPPPELDPFLAKYGLSPAGAEAPTEAGPDQQVAQVLSSLPPELASRPGLAEQVAKDLAGGATPEQILEQIQAVLAGGQ